MRCISSMVYQQNATSLYWYQSYHSCQWTTRIPLYSHRAVAENSLSPLKKMHAPMESQVTLLEPIVPLVPMDDRNPTVLNLNGSEISLSPLNEKHFTNSVPIECHVTLLVPIDERNIFVLKPNRSKNGLSLLNEMQFTTGVSIVPLVPINDRNRTGLTSNRSQNNLSPLIEMQFTKGVPMESNATH